MNDRTRERIIEMIRKLRAQTVEGGLSPAEAAAFAAKADEWMEKYAIEEEELRVKEGGVALRPEDVECCQRFIKTHKRVFNPGVTAVLNGLARGMCCKLIMMHNRPEAGGATYGIVGERLDADYVEQVGPGVVAALQAMATLEGREHGYEKAGLVRWSNQYLSGAGEEICRRIEAERKERSEVKKLEHEVRVAAADVLGADGPRAGGTPTGPGTALVLVTGETLAAVKKEATERHFKDLYPSVRTVRSKSAYDDTARRQGREAGRRVGLRREIGGKE